ncbi:MAG: MASE1 domain-containing protein [Novosphingobium sp.]|nr:MASE1 domain-containing protein [Novosphingobium sp.]
MSAETGDRQWSPRRLVAICLIAGSAYFLLSYLSIALTSRNAGVASVWPGNALIVAVMLLPSARGAWSWLLLSTLTANIAVNIVLRGTVSGPVLFGLANCLEILIVVLGLQRLTKDGGGLFSQPNAAWSFALWAGLIAPLASAIPGAAIASSFIGQNFTESLGIWYGSDAIGLILFTPFFFSLVNGEYLKAAREMSGRDRLEAIALLLLVSLSSLVFLQRAFPLLFLPFLPLSLVTFRLGWLGTSVGLIIVSVVGTVATVSGTGPVMLIDGNVLERELFLEIFITSLLLLNLPAAVALTSRRESMLALRQANGKLTEANLALERFASIASHDLKAPVRHVSLFADAIREENGARQPIATYATNIVKAASDMNRIIEALLMFSKSGFREPRNQRFAVAPFMEELLGSLSRDREEALAEIAVSGAAGTLFADRQLALQALRNVVANSIKYVPKGTPPVVRIAVGRPAPDIVQFDIRDNGIGIDPRFAHDVFLPLRRLHGADSGYEGVGLGLSLVRTIARAHNGDARIDETFAGGTRMLLSFGNQRSVR